MEGETPDEWRDDAALVERVQRGDAAAYDVLVRRYMRRAFAVAYRILGHREDAEDLVWEHAARWSRAAVPALLAASAVIAMLLAAPPLSAPDAGEPASVAEAADATPEQVAIDLALADDVPDGEVVDAFVAASEDAWILQWVTDDE